jgi:hypothetical protein
MKLIGLQEFLGCPNGAIYEIVNLSKPDQLPWPNLTDIRIKSDTVSANDWWYGELVEIESSSTPDMLDFAIAAQQENASRPIQRVGSISRHGLHPRPDLEYYWNFEEGDYDALIGRIQDAKSMAFGSPETET